MNVVDVQGDLKNFQIRKLGKLFILKDKTLIDFHLNPNIINIIETPLLTYLRLVCKELDDLFE